MPIFKHRKRKSSRKRNIVDLNIVESSFRRIRIRRHRFRELRNNPDFLAFVKVGRAVNAVASGVHFISDYIDDESPVGRRQYFRAFFMTSGFLYEGLTLVDSLRSQYLSESFFIKFNILIGKEYEKHRKVLREVRNSVAFHLDSNDKSTKLALKTLNLSRYDLMSGNSSLLMDFYFDFADTIDLNYIIDKFKDNRPESEVINELMTLITGLMKSFGSAGHEFLIGLGQKMKFSEYVD